MERGQLDICLITTVAFLHANGGIKAFESEAIEAKLL
jgi:hypothetical protein